MSKPHYIYRYFVRCEPGPWNPPGSTYHSRVFSHGGFFMVWHRPRVTADTDALELSKDIEELSKAITVAYK